MKTINLLYPNLGVSLLEASDDLISLWVTYLSKCELDVIRPIITPPEEKTSDFFTKNQNILDSFIFSSLNESINFNIDIYLKKIKSEFSNISVKSSWGCILNKNDKTRDFYSHITNSSLLKGIYSIDGEGSLNFSRKSSNNYSFSSSPKNSLIPQNFNLSISPGCLILFPGELKCEITRTNSSVNYISFNADL